jgi:hypothetical protein
MTATTIYNAAYFNSTSGHPLYNSGKPSRNPYGNIVPFSVVIPTTSSDEAADRVRLVPLPHGAKVKFVVFQCDDLDSSTGLDADLVIREDATDTIVYNAGSAFQSAVALRQVGPDAGSDNLHVVSESDGLDASLDFLVNTQGTTPAQGTISGFVVYE